MGPSRSALRYRAVTLVGKLTAIMALLAGTRLPLGGKLLLAAGGTEKSEN
jgi:hypothetical protein